MIRRWWAELLDSIVYPVRDRRWFVKSWPILLIALVPVIGLVSLVLLKGWRLHMIRNLARGTEQLPELDLPALLRDGMILWAFTFVYLIVPGLVCTLLGIGGPFGLLLDLISIGTGGMATWAGDEPYDWLASIAVYLLWAVISLPVYQVGLIRFATSGSWRAMLNIPANLALFVRYLPSFALYYLNWMVLVSLILFMDGVLAVTVVGIPFIALVTSVVYYSSTAHELGHLAARIGLASGPPVFRA